MRRNLYMHAVVAVVFTALLSCGGRGRTAVAEGDTLYMPRYASGFTVTEASGGRILNITDPWQGADGINMQLFFSPDGSGVPEGFEGVVLKTPPEKVVCMSSSYVAFLNELGVADVIKGISGAKYISDPSVRRAYADGRIREVGYDAALNFELLSVIDPDVVFAYGITGENSILSGKLSQLGIDVVYIGDYVEATPLGKAEWLVAFGYLFGQEEKARAIFEEIAFRYENVRESAAKDMDAGQRPVVVLNSPYRDTWFVPGDRNFMVRYIEDAGGVYAFAGVESDQSRPVSFEDAYVKMLSADVWLNPGQASSLREVLTENPRLAHTPPVINGQVYNNNKRLTPEGGSDFWEYGTVRPDVVLRDMVGILHPGLLPGEGSLYFFRKLDR